MIGDARCFWELSEEVIRQSVPVRRAGIIPAICSLAAKRDVRDERKDERKRKGDRRKEKSEEKKEEKRSEEKVEGLQQQVKDLTALARELAGQRKSRSRSRRGRRERVNRDHQFRGGEKSRLSHQVQLDRQSDPEAE